INDGLGKQYAQEYEEAQLAVRMVDWFVATEGCDNFRPEKAARLLDSEGLWLTLRRRLLKMWEGIWGPESVDRVALAVLRRMAERPPLDYIATPAECAGLQTFISLCEDGGDGAPARARLHTVL
ncbi:unnamed protein product, partial [Polarella glacialis]